MTSTTKVPSAQSLEQFLINNCTELGKWYGLSLGAIVILTRTKIPDGKSMFVSTSKNPLQDSARMLVHPEADMLIAFNCVRLEGYHHLACDNYGWRIIARAMRSWLLSYEKTDPSDYLPADTLFQRYDFAEDYSEFKSEVHINELDETAAARLGDVRFVTAYLDNRIKGLAEQGQGNLH